MKHSGSRLRQSAELRRRQRFGAHAGIDADGADLIVLGCRERHGLSILVNRTEDTVLHGAPCDVLAVRVR